ncbi:hypothetical protein O181_091091 [Austropuccinia psidii MF-1]|uniref:Uncharacterized protein n=1 Tax=Austropuccinia psidii MF-1 TaxID=1389203 RepID=A0A9Q3P9B1_9BASI|nr:hypothetical protein [Austropuccinia psidii MF-1]
MNQSKEISKESLPYEKLRPTRQASKPWDQSRLLSYLREAAVTRERPICDDATEFCVSAKTDTTPVHHPTTSANSSQNCGNRYGPISNAPNEKIIDCLNYGNYEYHCPKASCHTGNKTTAVTNATLAENALYFENCFSEDSRKNVTKIWPDAFIAHNVQGKLTVTSAHTVDDKLVKTPLKGAFTCTWVNRTDRNNQRPWCNDCVFVGSGER